MKTIFDKFMQTSTSKSGAGGTGLGLAICHQIVAGHGGRMWAENTDGGGLAVWLEQPRQYCPIADVAMSESPDRVGV